MRFFITSTARFFKIYFILFIQGRTRFKMNIVIHLWYKFIDILKSARGQIYENYKVLF